MEVKIRRPRIEDSNQIHQLFATTVHNNFKEEGLLETLAQEVDHEVQSLINTLNVDFKTQGKKEYFLLATQQDQILGTIAYGQATPLITKNLKLNYTNTPEIKSVYILPAFQNKGIGSQLFQAMLKTLSAKNITDFCLDSGYTKAQRYWKKKLGEPICILADYWSGGNHHMIWHKQVKELIE